MMYADKINWLNTDITAAKYELMMTLISEVYGLLDTLISLIHGMM